MVPAAIFIVLRFALGTDPNSVFAHIATVLWFVAIMGLIFSKFARSISFSEHPIAFVVLGVLVYLLSAFAIIIAGVNLGLMAP